MHEYIHLILHQGAPIPFELPAEDGGTDAALAGRDHRLRKDVEKEWAEEYPICAGAVEGCVCGVVCADFVEISLPALDRFDSCAWMSETGD